MPNRYLLSKEEVYQLVSDNTYEVDESLQYKSRLMEGRYNNVNSLPGLALPGGDIGDLAVLYSAGKSYGFEVNHDMALDSISSVVGGIKHLLLPSDNTFDPPEKTPKMDELSQLWIDPPAFFLDESLLSVLEKQVNLIKESNRDKYDLAPYHNEGAVLIVTGEYGIYPQYEFMNENNTISTQVYIYHSTFLKKRYKMWSKKLVEEKVVTLYSGMDEEYLYEVLEEVSENYLFEMLRKVAPTIPIYNVDISDKNKIKVLPAASE